MCVTSSEQRGDTRRGQEEGGRKRLSRWPPCAYPWGVMELCKVAPPATKPVCFSVSTVLASYSPLSTRHRHIHTYRESACARARDSPLVQRRLPAPTPLAKRDAGKGPLKPRAQAHINLLAYKHKKTFVCLSVAPSLALSSQFHPHSHQTYQIMPMNSDMTLRWYQGGRKVCSCGIQRGGKITKSATATPGSSDWSCACAHGCVRACRPHNRQGKSKSAVQRLSTMDRKVRVRAGLFF